MTSESKPDAREYLKDFGRRVQSARCKQDITIRELAEAAKVTPATISNIEYGRSSCSLETAVLICNKLQLSFDANPKPEPQSESDAELAQLEAERRKIMTANGHPLHGVIAEQHVRIGWKAATAKAEEEIQKQIDMRDFEQRFAKAKIERLEADLADLKLKQAELVKAANKFVEHYFVNSSDSNESKNLIEALKAFESQDEVKS